MRGRTDRRYSCKVLRGVGQQPEKGAAGDSFQRSGQNGSEQLTGKSRWDGEMQWTQGTRENSGLTSTERRTRARIYSGDSFQRSGQNGERMEHSRRSRRNGETAGLAA
jgi:hypothetical protein